MTETQAAVIEAMEEIVRRYAWDGDVYPDPRQSVLDASDPLEAGRKFADLFHVGPYRSNGAVCRGCGETIESANRHDYRTCSCGNVSVDGGTWYCRRSFKDAADWESYSSCWPWTRVGADGVLR